MDSLTHITLGACLGEVMLGKRIGKRALLLGAVTQNLPDIDAVVNLWLSPSASLLAHRGLTHSLPVGLVVAVSLAYMVRRWPPARTVPVWWWFLFFAVQLGVHDLLDTTNAYGTGLLEPFSHERFSWHLLYVIDPLFTGPLLVIAILLFGFGPERRSRSRWVTAGLVWAGSYVVSAVVNQAVVNKFVNTSLLAAHIPATRFLTTPTPFNTLLWYVVANTKQGYYVGYRSVLDSPSRTTTFTFFPRQTQSGNGAGNSANVDRLLRFANGYYTFDKTNRGLAINVLRFGQMGGWRYPGAPFTFHYEFDHETDERLVTQRGRFSGWDRETIRAYYQRMLGDMLPWTALKN